MGSAAAARAAASVIDHGRGLTMGHRMLQEPKTMSERHGRYYGPRAVPCACGSNEAYWHGPDGMREYACDRCWERMQRERRADKGS